MSGISNPCASAAGRKGGEVKWEGEKTSWLGGRGASVLGLLNNALVNSSGTEMQCRENRSYPLEPTALNLRAVA